MEENTIVLYPCSGISHLVPMVEFGRRLLAYSPSFSITVLIATLPSDAASTAAYIESVTAAAPSTVIKFHHLPTVSFTKPSGFPDLIFEFMTLNDDSVGRTLESMSQISSVQAFILDFFCYTSSEISANLNIPTYFFNPSGAAGLALFLFFPTIDRICTKSLKDDPNIHIHLPGTPLFVASDLPPVLLDRSAKAYKYFLDTAKRMAKSSGIISNTFTLLEPRAMKAISEGFCVPDAPTPPAFCVGPLITTDNSASGGGDEHQCLSWLSAQPSRSVVFLCFGSRGVFSSEQLKEIAIALESSGMRFLWVVRMERREGETPQTTLESCLPDGFLERTKDRGYVVNSWVPQMAVLSHDSVGGFVTHCGWNSILESICAGVPMVAWPLYAEQKFNSVVLVEELKVALRLNRSANEIVSATELEKRLAELMYSEKGRALRDRVAAMKEDAQAAMREDGPQRVELAELVESFKRAPPS